MHFRQDVLFIIGAGLRKCKSSSSKPVLVRLRHPLGPELAPFEDRITELATMS
jgi:hypothetical protein